MRTDVNEVEYPLIEEAKFRLTQAGSLRETYEGRREERPHDYNN